MGKFERQTADLISQLLMLEDPAIRSAATTILALKYTEKALANRHTERGWELIEGLHYTLSQAAPFAIEEYDLMVESWERMIEKEGEN